MPFKIVPKFYQAWRSMKGRCYNPNYPQFADYGGRGITVCDRWINDYKAFESDMGERPEGYSLDRIDNDLGYSPENCRWANRATQQRNQRRAVYVEIEGNKYRAIELALMFDLKADTIVDRSRKGMTFDQVISNEKHHNLSGFYLGGKASGAKKQALTHCKHGHEFTEHNTIITPQGWRRCRECHNIKMRRLSAAKRSANRSSL